MKRTDLITLAMIFCCGACATDQIPSSGNRAPFANAGDDREVEVGSAVTLDASKSADPDGHTLSYRWEFVPPEGSYSDLDSDTNLTTGFVADVPGIYEITLVATDGRLDSPPDTVRITAVGAAAGGAPIASVDAPSQGSVGERVQLDGTQSEDPDGDSLFFDWVMELRPDGSAAALDDPRSPTPSFVPDVAGNYEISLIVSDGLDQSPPRTFVFTALGAMNAAPTANAGRDVSTSTGETVQLDGSDSDDPEGGPLFYIWSMVGKPDGSSATLDAADVEDPSFTPDVDGDYVIQLVVTDGLHQSEPDTVTVTAVTGNVPPNAHAGPDQSVEVGDVAYLDGTKSTDNEGDTLTYTWRIVGAPSTSSAVLQNQFSSMARLRPDVAGDYIIELIVNDGTANSAPDQMTITATSQNAAPFADAGPDVDTRAGEMVLLDGTGSIDPDGDTLTYSWVVSYKPTTSSPQLYDASTDVAVFTPDMPGTYSLLLTVSDGTSEDSDMVTVSVVDPWPARKGDVVISEVMPNPDTMSDTQGEWFELYNPTAFDWDLKDCVIEDEADNQQDNDVDEHTIVSPLKIPSMGYVTLARASNPGFAPDYVYGNDVVLANSDDELVFVCGMTEIARVAWGGGGFPYEAGHSMSLLRDEMDETANDNPANWCKSTTDYNGDFGTPGAPNESQSTCLP